MFKAMLRLRLLNIMFLKHFGEYVHKNRFCKISNPLLRWLFGLVYMSTCVRSSFMEEEKCHILMRRLISVFFHIPLLRRSKNP